MDRLNDWFVRLFGANYGNVASGVSFVITIFGFLATLWNLSRTKAVAEGARRAAREGLAKITTQMSANEAYVILLAVRDIESKCRDKGWTEAIRACDDARTKLILLRDRKELFEGESSEIESSITFLNNTLRYLVRVRDSKPDTSFPPAKMKELQKTLSLLGRVMARLQNSTWEP